MTEYHSTDFDFNDWEQECLEKYTLPPIKFIENQAKPEEFSDQWDSFFSSHNSGNFFKPRRYLALEFSKYLNGSHVKRLLEVGCGHGCSMYPLLESCGFEYIATDYSINALNILKSHSKYNIKRTISVEHWDVTENPSQSLIDTNPEVVLAVFALSAIIPELHIQCFQNMIQLFTHNTNVSNDTRDTNPVILFRDYAICDMTMFRHTTRYNTQHLYQRSDGTLAYYFDLEYIRNICVTVGLEVVELEYATVRVTNRKNNNVMNRVFIHGVFRWNGGYDVVF